MGRPKSSIPAVMKNVSFREDLAKKMDLELYSELEGKVPHGAMSTFINTLLTAHFKSKRVQELIAQKRPGLGEELLAQAMLIPDVPEEPAEGSAEDVEDA